MSEPKRRRRVPRFILDSIVLKLTELRNRLLVLLPEELLLLPLLVLLSLLLLLLLVLLLLLFVIEEGVCGGSNRSSLLLLIDAAILDRRRCQSACDGLGTWTSGAPEGSNANDDDSDDTRDSAGSSGERGGAKPVMQSMTRTRGSRGGVAEGRPLLDRLAEAPCFRRTSRVASGWFRRSTRWTAEYVKYLCSG